MKNEIVKTDTQIQNSLPVGRGFEAGIDQTDIIIPRAQLLQSTSDEIKEGLDGLKIGMIINSLTKEQLPEIMIPIFTYKNWVKFDAERNVVWATNDPHDPRVKDEAFFGINGEKPTAVTFMNFFSFFPNHSMPVIVSFAKTSYKAGKMLLSLARLSGGDMFSYAYKLTSKNESNGTDTYKVLNVAAARKSTDKEIEICARWYKEFSKVTDRIEIDEEKPWKK